jgi:hypothetical protein
MDRPGPGRPRMRRCDLKVRRVHCTLTDRDAEVLMAIADQTQLKPQELVRLFVLRGIQAQRVTLNIHKSHLALEGPKNADR